EQGSTIFINTHNMEEATVICDRVAFLHEGEIKELDTPEKLRYKYSSHKFHVTTKDEEELDFPNDATSADDIATLIKMNNVKFIQTNHLTIGETISKCSGKEVV